MMGSNQGLRICELENSKRTFDTFITYNNGLINDIKRVAMSGLSKSYCQQSASFG